MGQANTSPTKSKSTRKANSLRLSQEDTNGPRLEDKDLPWRMSSRSDVRFVVRKLYRGPSIWHQYGWRKRSDNTHEDPVALFTCKMESKRSRKIDELDEICRSIVVALIRHRSGMNCDCELGYITRGSTQKTSDICETRDKAVLKTVKRYDKICTCGVFGHVEQEKEKPRPRKTALHLEIKKVFHTPESKMTPMFSKEPASSEMPICSNTFEEPTYPNTSTPSIPSRTPTPDKPLKTLTSPYKHPLDYSKGPFDDLPDYDEQNIFKGLPRKW